MCPKFVFVLIFIGFAFSGSLLTYRLGSRGFGAGRVSKTHIWINCNSFCFIFTVRKASTRVESSLIFAFKSEISAAWFCLGLAALGLLALRWDLLVAEGIQVVL